jgi:hypothetical protein
VPSCQWQQEPAGVPVPRYPQLHQPANVGVVRGEHPGPLSLSLVSMMKFILALPCMLRISLLEVVSCLLMYDEIYQTPQTKTLQVISKHLLISNFNVNN